MSKFRGARVSGAGRAPNGNTTAFDAKARADYLKTLARRPARLKRRTRGTWPELLGASLLSIGLVSLPFLIFRPAPDVAAWDIPEPAPPHAVFSASFAAAKGLCGQIDVRGPDTRPPGSALPKPVAGQGCGGR